jgi:signal transduction histidine kinase
MKAKLNMLSARYLAALDTHLKESPQPSLQLAHGLGVQAVDIGLETLDMAKMHETALASLPVPASCATRDEMTNRASIFFTEAITPIEETHRAAMDGKAHLEKQIATLNQRTRDVAESKNELQAGILKRKAAEEALKTSSEHYSQLLKESCLLEEYLQDMARKILSANEDERKKMSLQLRDEIGQALVGIHVRLLALKKEVSVNQASLTKEIITTQRLVETSVKTISRLTRDFGLQYEK